MIAAAEQLDAFAVLRDLRTDRQREVARLIARAVPIAQRIAVTAGVHGITAENLWRALKAESVITGGETGRSLSWLRHVFPAAGLVNTRRTRRNARNRNDNDVWVTRESASVPVFLASDLRP